MQVLFIFAVYFGMMCCFVLSINPLTKNYWTPVRKLNKVQYRDNFDFETDDLRNLNTEWKQDNQVPMSDSKQVNVKESIQKLFRNHHVPSTLSFPNEKTPEKHRNNYNQNMTDRGFEILNGGILNNNVRNSFKPKSTFGRPLYLHKKKAVRNDFHSGALKFHPNNNENVEHNEITEISSPIYLVKHTRFDKERPFQPQTVYLIAREYPSSQPQSSSRLSPLSKSSRNAYGMPPSSSNGAYGMPPSSSTGAYGMPPSSSNGAYGMPPSSSNGAYAMPLPTPPEPEKPCQNAIEMTPAPKPQYSSGGAYAISSSPPPKPAYPSNQENGMSPAPIPAGGAYKMPPPPPPKMAYPSKYEDWISSPPSPPNKYQNGMTPSPTPIPAGGAYKMPPPPPQIPAGSAYKLPPPTPPKMAYPSISSPPSSPNNYESVMSPTPIPAGGAYGMPSPSLPNPEYPSKGATEMTLPPQTEYPSGGGYGMPSPTMNAYGNNMASGGDNSLQTMFMDVKGKTSNFGYEVDNKVNDFHNHRQTDDGVAATGSYSWRDDKGNLNTVDYVADHVTGYRAVVRNAEGRTQWGFVKDDNEGGNSGDENPSYQQMSPNAVGYGNPQPSPPSAVGYGNPQPSPPSAVGYGNPQPSLPSAVGYGNPQLNPPSAVGYGNPQPSPPSAVGYGKPNSPNAVEYGNLQPSPQSAVGYGNPQPSPPSAVGYGNPQPSPPSAVGYGNPQPSPPSAVGYGKPNPPNAVGYGNPQPSPPNAVGYGNPQPNPQNALGYGNPQSNPPKQQY